MVLSAWISIAAIITLAAWQATQSAAAPADPAPPHFPPVSEWCYLKSCAQPPTELITHAVDLDRQMFGGDAAPPVCGDRICNIQRGETCLSCPSDCGGPCRATQPLVQCVTPRQMALTFDDGSSPFTTELVHTLNRLEVPASFFVLGETLQRDPALAKATKFAFDSGHLIGSHTYTHRSMGDSGIVQFSVRPPPLAPMPFWHLRTELLFTDLSIFSVIGRRPRIVRPPYLEFNAASMAFLETAGYSVVNINLDTFDWRFNQTAEATPERVLAELQTQLETAKSQPSWIHLQHDTLGYSTAAVREIVAFLRARDVKFVTMDKCLGVDAYRGAADNPHLGQRTATQTLLGGSVPRLTVPLFNRPAEGDRAAAASPATSSPSLVDLRTDTQTKGQTSSAVRTAVGPGVLGIVLAALLMCL